MPQTRTVLRSCVGVALAIAVTLAAPIDLVSKSLGKGSDPMLQAMAAALDAQGIDVVPGQARALVFKKELRPRLAKLGGFPIPNAVAESGNDWTGPFATGAFGYVAGYRLVPSDLVKAEPAPPTGEMFMEEWSKSEQSSRVFVAFTRADAASAER